MNLIVGVLTYLWIFATNPDFQWGQKWVRAIIKTAHFICPVANMWTISRFFGGVATIFVWRQDP
ncbi:MAG: hypothetical protein CO139_00450 [Candidatus Moranbacteria bacterium CG_4_9_14_3_um_filter_36_9]|nr:MAG: hypothetical protein CO139_00450 [Candidatus Moranbacteria bacterium CG_4_9_14_3_um_filter_36_9]